MRKYVVPIVALAGIALLSPSADAANLYIKSRAIDKGSSGRLPLMVNNVTGGGQLWGIDVAMKFANVGTGASADDVVPAANAFLPVDKDVTIATGRVSPAYDQTKDVVVTGKPSVATTGTNPDLYIGYVRGAKEMPSTVGTGNPANAIGHVKLTLGANAVRRDVIDITVGQYYVENNGQAGDDQREGATAALSTDAANAAVTPEPVTVVSGFLPGLPATTPDKRVPLNKIAVGAPGDVNGNGGIDIGDVSLTAGMLANKATVFNDFRRIAADIAGANGYTPAAPFGDTGRSYGNGQVDIGDVSILAAKLANKNPASFPNPALEP